MTDEKENKEQQQEEKPRLSVLEETRAAIETLKKEKEEIAQIKKELEELRSDQLLSGTAGIKPQTPPAKEETAKDYMQRVMSGGLNEKATEEA